MLNLLLLSRLAALLALRQGLLILLPLPFPLRLEGDVLRDRRKGGLDGPKPLQYEHVTPKQTNHPKAEEHEGDLPDRSTSCHPLIHTSTRSSLIHEI